MAVCVSRASSDGYVCRYCWAVACLCKGTVV